MVEKNAYTIEKVGNEILLAKAIRERVIGHILNMDHKSKKTEILHLPVKIF
tara:strand:- start:132 stop:284 length:153 start_codon:yes stop_codon:yes gene_type:complete